MPVNVLICDDSSFARKQLQKALPPEWDVNVHFAGDGQEGLEAIREGKGELVFLDLTMPVLDGYGVLEKIRAEKLATAVVVVSGDIQLDAQDQARKLGAVGFIKKPTDSEKMRSALEVLGFIART